MARQHGVISGAQLDRLGAGRSAVRTAVRNGWLALVAPGVFASTAAAITVDYRRTLGLLGLGPDAVVSHRAAAFLHEFDRSSPDIVEFTVARGARNAKLDMPVHSTFVLPRIDRVTVGGYPCTSATRTIIDLARLRVPPVAARGGDRLGGPHRTFLTRGARRSARRPARTRTLGCPAARRPAGRHRRAHDARAPPPRGRTPSRFAAATNASDPPP